MDTYELNKKIGVVFDRELDVIKHNSSPIFSYKLKEDDSKLSRNRSELMLKTALWTVDPPLLVDSPSDFTLVFPNLDILKKLFAVVNHSENLKLTFIIDMTSRIQLTKILDSDKKFIDTSHLSFALLVKTGYIDEALDALIVREKQFGVLGCFFCLKFLEKFIRYEYRLFNDDQLLKLKRAIEQFKSNALGDPQLKKETILRQINELRCLKLEKELEGVNLEINKDKEEVIAKLKFFKFPKKLALALNKIEEHFSQTAKDSFDYSMVIGKIREFLTLLYEVTAKRLQEITKIDIPKHPSTGSLDYKGYVIEHLGLKEGENWILKGLAKITNSEGSHELISEKKYLRLTKNICIEITLLILTKLEKF